MSEPLLNPNADIQILLLGKEQQSLLVVDDLLLNPELLLEWATQGDAFVGDPANYYPGVRKVLPASYGEMVTGFMQSLVPKIPALAAYSGIDVRQSALAITNQDPATLLPIQRIPHFDSCDPRQWAMVHYLCSAEYGGTGFFRHQRSSFESITADKQRKYQRLLEDDAATVGLPIAQYLQGSSSLFEQTHKVEAKFNRALFYPSNMFHSGLIKHWQSSQIGQCRLTANCFLQFA